MEHFLPITCRDWSYRMEGGSKPQPILVGIGLLPIFLETYWIGSPKLDDLKDIDFLVR